MSGRLWLCILLLWSSAGCFGTLQTRPLSTTAPTQAPDIRLKAHQGSEVTLSSALSRGPVILVFYRGHW